MTVLVFFLGLINVFHERIGTRVRDYKDGNGDRIARSAIDRGSVLVIFKELVRMCLSAVGISRLLCRGSTGR